MYELILGTYIHFNKINMNGSFWENTALRAKYMYSDITHEISDYTDYQKTTGMKNNKYKVLADYLGKILPFVKYLQTILSDSERTQFLFFRVAVRVYAMCKSMRN